MHMETLRDKIYFKFGNTCIVLLKKWAPVFCGIRVDLVNIMKVGTRIDIDLHLVWHVCPLLLEIYKYNMYILCIFLHGCQSCSRKTASTASHPPPIL